MKLKRKETRKSNLKKSKTQLTDRNTLKIPLLRPYFDSEELEEVKKVLDSGWVSQGPKVKEFEDKIAGYLDIKYAIAVANCTSALHLALLSIDVKKEMKS